MIHQQSEKNAAQEAELTSLHQELEDYSKKYEEVADLRQKLEESQALHSTTLEKLNRIHEDKLQSLEIELQAARQERLGAEDDVNVKYGQDLEELRLSHQEELTQLLTDHGEEVDTLKNLFEQKIEEAKEQVEVTKTVFLLVFVAYSWYGPNRHLISFKINICELE